MFKLGSLRLDYGARGSLVRWSPAIGRKMREIFCMLLGRGQLWFSQDQKPQQPEKWCLDQEEAKVELGSRLLNCYSELEGAKPLTLIRVSTIQLIPSIN